MCGSFPRLPGPCHKGGMPARWFELSVQARGPAQDTISSFLVEQGSTGVVCGERSLRAFFPETVDDAVLRPAVRRYLRGLRGILPTGSWAVPAGG